MKKLWPIIFLLLLFSGLIIGLVLVQKEVFFLPRANETGKVSPLNSYIFASPLAAQADGKAKIRITVFVLDTEGMGVAGKPVFLGEDKRLSINPVQGVTDNLGRAIFDVSSLASADYFIEARVENQVLPQKVKVSFR